jgi:hypothetical protein
MTKRVKRSRRATKRVKRSRKSHGKKRQRKYTMKGGNKPLFYKMKKSAIPPFYGYSWELAKPNTWPGVAGVGGASNYFSINKYNKQPGYNGYTNRGY